MKKKKELNKIKNKIVVLIGLLVVTILASSYAWWTMTVKTNRDVTMGELDVEANFPSVPSGKYYEPDTTSIIEGTVKNTGNIEAIFKVTNNSEIQFKYLDDNKTLSNDSAYYPDVENAIDITMNPKSGSYDDDGVYWFENKNNPSERYVLIEPDETLELKNTAYFKPEVMGIKYQSSQIKVIGDLVVTNFTKGSIKHSFGIEVEDLKGLVGNVKSRSVNSTIENRADKKLEELDLK